MDEHVLMAMHARIHIHVRMHMRVTADVHVCARSLCVSDTYEQTNPEQRYSEAFQHGFSSRLLVAIKRTSAAVPVTGADCLLHGSRFQNVVDSQVESRGLLSIRRRPKDFIARSEPTRHWEASQSPLRLIPPKRSF
jgi:hypothetical protein